MNPTRRLSTRVVCGEELRAESEESKRRIRVNMRQCVENREENERAMNTLIKNRKGAFNMIIKELARKGREVLE